MKSFTIYYSVFSGNNIPNAKYSIFYGTMKYFITTVQIINSTPQRKNIYQIIWAKQKKQI